MLLARGWSKSAHPNAQSHQLQVDDSNKFNLHSELLGIPSQQRESQGFRF